MRGVISSRIALSFVFLKEKDLLNEKGEMRNAMRGGIAVRKVFLISHFSFNNLLFYARFKMSKR